VVDPVNDPYAKRSRSGHLLNFLARDRVVQKFLRDQIGTACERCFLDSCPGTPGENKAPPCATAGSPHYVPAAWSHVLKSILMWLKVDREKCGKLFDAFYASMGKDFGSFTAMVKTQLDTTMNKADSLTYNIRSGAAPGLSHVASFPVDTHQRCLASLPDLGNPSMLAGICWWKEYGGLLAGSGILKTIRKAKSDEQMSFGDGPHQPPLFVLLQVPLWYRCAIDPPLLIFSNFRIVPNQVGL
jgi:hypothetical protein